MTKLNDWLFSKTPSISDPPPPSQYIGEAVDFSDIDTEKSTQLNQIDLEEVIVVIDYRDSEGRQSRRQITLRSLARGPNAPILRAICHTRRAVRHFRCDRIDGFIDDYGEVLDCRTFFLHTMAVDLTDFAPQIKTTEKKTPTALSAARAARDELRAPLSILVALARSDEIFALEELNEICKFVDTIAPNVREQAHPGEVETGVELRNLIRRMRPSREALPGYMAEVNALLASPWYRNVFEETLNNVLYADGKLAKGEKTLLDDLGFIPND